MSTIRKDKGIMRRVWSLVKAIAPVLAFTAALGSPPVMAGPGRLSAEAARPDATELTRVERRWVRSTLGRMSLERKAAQLILVKVEAHYQHPRSAARRKLWAQINELGIGGIVLSDADLESIPSLLETLQKAGEIPLIVASDLERSLAFRVDRGSVPVPSAMAVGATRSLEAARFIGELTAREARAVGIHWVFAPVADINSNPSNPIIGARSFGEDPELVGQMVRSFVEGARAGGVLTTAKHFPGHGDTVVDSHVGLPTLDHDREQLAAIELHPFRQAIAAGVDAVMMGHIAVPGLDSSAVAASLSRLLTTQLLREELSFTGLIVSDALDMAALKPSWGGAIAVRAVLAGNDVLLMPEDPSVAVGSLVRAVNEGDLSRERLDDSVRRILEAKARLGLDRHARLEEPRLDHIARPADIAHVEDIARASVTILRDEQESLPLRAEKAPRILHLVLGGRPGRRGLPTAELESRRLEVETLELGFELSSESLDRAREAADRATHIVLAAHVNRQFSPSQLRLFDALRATGRPLVLISFGSPYLLSETPWISTYINAYGSSESSRKAALEILLGEAAASGVSPVTIPGLHPNGHGVKRSRRSMTLKLRSQPQADPAFIEVDRLLSEGVANGAFPGCTVAIGLRGELVHHGSYGLLSPHGAAATTDTIYDLASLTKVIATTTMAMILVDEGRLDLDSPVTDFLPHFRGRGKVLRSGTQVTQVTVRHLLSHSSGLAAGGDLHLELRGTKAFIDHIQDLELEYETGSRSLYSDYGFILLGEILERVAGRSLADFANERIFGPLAMKDTAFRPAVELRNRIAPTEMDPWRARLVHGEVHDEKAFAMGGIAPHAGLFSTTGDLARFAQMMLYGGVFEHRRLVSNTTLASFITAVSPARSSRALGWDKKSPSGSTAGTLFSTSSYGHTGFTGTSLWIDPERELFLIFLSNRVHPSRDNIQIRQVRPALADAVVKAVESPAFRNR